MYWRLGAQLPALLPDGEDSLPLPLPAGTHLPDPAAANCPAACQRPPVQVRAQWALGLQKNGERLNHWPTVAHIPDWEGYGR